MSLHKLVSAQQKLVNGGERSSVTNFDLHIAGRDVKFVNTEAASWAQLRDKARLLGADADLATAVQKLQKWLAEPFRSNAKTVMQRSWFSLF